MVQALSIFCVLYLYEKKNSLPPLRFHLTLLLNSLTHLCHHLVLAPIEDLPVLKFSFLDYFYSPTPARNRGYRRHNPHCIYYKPILSDCLYFIRGLSYPKKQLLLCDITRKTHDTNVSKSFRLCPPFLQLDGSNHCCSISTTNRS